MLSRYKATKTPSSGTVSWNTDNFRGVLRQMLVSPTTSTTTYNVSMVDDDSIPVYSKKGCKGTLNDISAMGLYGIYTFTISSSSVDEAFKISIRYEEIV